MTNKLKLIIADDEQLICSMLAKIIDFESLGLELIGTAFDGETLLSAIEAKQPDIVITDICMPKIDGLEIIRRVRENSGRCRFVIISGFRQFDYAYNALKYDVEDYILKPVEQAELNAALKKIAESIRNEAFGEQSKNGAMRLFFVTKAVEELASKPMSIEEINKLYGTNFREGLFRSVFVKIDYTSGIQQIDEDASSMINKIKGIVTTHFAERCWDMVFEEKIDGVRILLNYSPAYNKEIKDGMLNLFSQTNSIIELFRGMNLTICVSGVVNNICNVVQLRDQTRVAEWGRMAYGINKIIFYEDMAKVSSFSNRNKLNELEIRLIKAFEILDIDSFKTCINEFFTMSTSVLCHEESILFIRRIQENFFTINEENIMEYTDYDALRLKIRRMLHFCTTFAYYKETLVTQFANVMERIAENISKQSARPIRYAYAYVEKNYGNQISLENIAKEVKLSPVYFSNLFKKETGQNFTEYLTEYRMKVAKGLLKKSDKNISEIAYCLGFADARYFSKLFKKTVGIKPTEYRKIYG